MKAKDNEANKLIVGIVIFAIVIAFVMMIKEYGNQPYTVYAAGNDGFYYAITYYPCKVIARTESELVVEHNGEAYACYYDGNEHEGNVVWAGFARYGNEIEFVGLQERSQR